jgi:hypothetical protein
MLIEHQSCLWKADNALAGRVKNVRTGGVLIEKRDRSAQSCQVSGRTVFARTDTKRKKGRWNELNKIQIFL